MSFWSIRSPAPASEVELLAYLVAQRLELAVEIEEDEAGEEAALLIRSEARLDAERREMISECYLALALRPADLIESYESDESWREGWRDAFVPTRLCPEVSVRPPWEEESQLAPLELIIDPGLAFGTGTHPTTQGAMGLLAAELAERASTQVLDFGAGSAILSIAAARWGHQVVAVESDPVAVKSARENLRLNGVEGRVKLSCGDQPPAGTFGLTVANIIAPVLIEHAPALIASAPRLVLSGLLESQERAVLDAFSGLYVSARWTGEGDWVALLLTKEELQ